MVLFVLFNFIAMFSVVTSPFISLLFGDFILSLTTWDSGAAAMNKDVAKCLTTSTACRHLCSSVVQDWWRGMKGSALESDSLSHAPAALKGQL